MQKLKQLQTTISNLLEKNIDDIRLKKLQKKTYRNLFIGFAFFCLTINVYAQEKSCKIVYTHRKIIQYGKDSIFAVAESDVKHNFKLKFSKSKIFFYNDQLLVNNIKVYCFTNIEYYHKFVHFTRNKKDYIYLYPQYKNYYTPYTHQELGILVEIKNDKIVVKENLDDFDDDEICEVTNFKNYKILKKKQKECAGSDIEQ